MNVLVVEDDAQLAELLERVLRDDAHVPTVCGSLRDATAHLAVGTFDVAVVDRSLPDGDGLQLCAQLQCRQPPLPVLVLTARGDVTDRVEGLRQGADDYMAKPFDVDELVARLHTIHRRASRSWLSTIGALELDRRAQTVTAAGVRLDLTGREYALLARLADSPEECVSRATLLLEVWNTRSDGASGVIDVHVSRLRDKLGHLGWMVETVRGRGLRLRERPP